MFSFFKRTDPVAEAATEIYGSVVAQVRRPEFYTLGEVPDTLEGRFELLVMHLWLAIDQLRVTHGSRHPLPKKLTAKFVEDIDDQYREFGISDQKVPRKVKKAAAGLFDRTMEYRALVTDANWPGLQSAIAANIHRSETPAVAEYLMNYVQAARAHLADIPASELDAGRISFPTPDGRFVNGAQ
jgi:cytochrome b pre-mRNA-processing protein 3